MAPMVEAAVEAVELETWVSEIADLQQHYDKLQTRLEKGGKKVQCSNMTNRGGTTRAPFWVPVRVQGGAAIQQFGSDTANAVPAWGRGTGSQWVSFASQPVRLVNVCEISNLSQQATSDKERGLVKVSKEEMDKSLLSYENGVEALLNNDASGTIDQIPATATVSSASGSGAQTSYIQGVNVAARFVDQQVVQVFPSIGGTTRGTATISYVDPVTNTLWFSTALPATGGATAAGDFLVVQGSSGAAGNSVYGKNYWINNSNTGTRAGVNVANYPSRFVTPVINFGGSGTISNSTAQRVESIRMRALGDDYEEGEESFWYANPVQGVALADQFYNPGFTRLDEGGKEVPDVAKRNMQATWGGREIVYSSTADSSRIDLFVPSVWYFGEMFPTRLHDWMPGTPVIAPPVNDGSGNTFWDSTMFAYERAFNLICSDSKRQFAITGLPVPSNS
jgi:hypothetical protein